MPDEIPYREFGRSGERISAIGIGGFHLGIPEDPDVAVEIVRRALDAGVNFLDNSWDYNAGESERRMGRALRGGYRGRAFLMTKLDSRSRDGVLRQFEQSCKRLGTGTIDLLQAHEVIRYGDVEDFLAPGGGLDAFLELREEGAVRFIGFTGHKDPDIHLAMLRAALDRGFTFDAAQMPVNAFDAHYRSFSEFVLPLCAEQGIAAIGMKPLGAGRLVGVGGLSATDLLAWALSQSVSTIVTGCESLADLEQALCAARGFEPLGPDELARISADAIAPASDGSLEPYKTGTEHDSTTFNPDWLA
jgi:aryl-alcohol dehydrogenase-like predicted oxidoreductase